MFAGAFKSSAAAPARKKAAPAKAGPQQQRGGAAGGGKAGGKGAKGHPGEARPEVARPESFKFKKKKADEVARGGGAHADAPAAGEPLAGLSKKARKRARERQQQEDKLAGRKGKPARREEPVTSTLLSASTGNNPIGRAAARLQGSRFRWLNERLYTTTGAEAKALYDEDPSLAHAYHEGFRAQAAKWPRNPLDDAIAWIRKDVPEDKVIGDFGCGEARLALECSGHAVHSLDLIAVNDRVTPCNLADAPLPDASLDVCVFCLALMGTDWLKFLAEAHRCLRPKGTVHIAEVESRFADMDGIVAQIEAIGFKQVLFKPGSFFVELRFVKAVGGKAARGHAKRKLGAQGGGGKLLKACTYQRR